MAIDGRSTSEEVFPSNLWFPAPEELDREELQRFGAILDRKPASLRGQTVCMALASRMLRVRTRDGKTEPLRANAVQRAFELQRGQRNIVLKARQMGLTTWAAGRFFLKTILQPGTLTLEVAHTQEAAEEIFRIVHRFVHNMPEALRTHLNLGCRGSRCLPPMFYGQRRMRFRPNGTAAI